MKTWPEYLTGETLFTNAIRLRNLIWTIQRFVPLGSKLLEVGFGSGATAVLLADIGYRVTAIDINKELVERACSKYVGWIKKGLLDIRIGNMLELPWDHSEFDLVYHQGVLEHFSDDVIVHALREQARVAPLIIFDVPNHRCKKRSFGDERLLAPQQWRRLAREAGLDIVYEGGRDFPRYLYFLPFALFSRKSLDVLPWFGRTFGANSIFVCKTL
jgi:2-polyprenyl-3-methyl-5-hydroxy-6-metoxy-1,4-benzoquinol methylase